MESIKKETRGRKPVNKTGYQVDEAEESFVIIKARQGGFSSDTGEPLNKEAVLKFTPQMWSVFRQHAKAQGWNLIEMLHVPTDTKTKIEKSLA